MSILSTITMPPSEPEDIGLPPVLAAHVGMGYSSLVPEVADVTCGAYDEILDATCTKEADHFGDRHADASDPATHFVWIGPRR